MDHTRMLTSLLLLLLAAATALAATPVAGDMRVVVLAGSKGGGHRGNVDDAVRHLMTSTTRVEDAVAAELGVDMELHRRILAATVGAAALKPDRAACPQACPARGGSYTGRGCKSVYRCNNGGG
ncbi:uncharacterized protein LOC121054301 [Oryza brachyantha]|uniref:uncharacterized protein LOC121054301 n=1 Tax=Oryza brachyantha TaxID=4533 RepID=UPI001ADD0EA9|nr:uncharacterized protein LOC121054301 [Oryza brachyantha]